MATMTGDRIKISDMREIITRAMDGLDLEHDAEWSRPPGCPCHRGEQSCLLPMETGSCQGRAIEAGTPADHIVTGGHLLSALPVPGNDGTVDMAEAATGILRVISGRLTGAYIIRAHSLVRRLTEESSSGSRLTVTVPYLCPRRQGCQGAGTAAGRSSTRARDIAPHRIGSRPTSAASASKGDGRLTASVMLVICGGRGQRPARLVSGQPEDAARRRRTASPVHDYRRPASLPPAWPTLLLPPRSCKSGIRKTAETCRFPDRRRKGPKSLARHSFRLGAHANRARGGELSPMRGTASLADNQQPGQRCARMHSLPVGSRTASCGATSWAVDGRRQPGHACSMSSTRCASSCPSRTARRRCASWRRHAGRGFKAA